MEPHRNSYRVVGTQFVILDALYEARAISSVCALVNDGCNLDISSRWHLMNVLYVSSFESVGSAGIFLTTTFFLGSS